MKTIIKSEGYLKKTAQRFGNERRFRGSAYFDVFVPATEDYEADKAKAGQLGQNFVDSMYSMKGAEGISEPYFAGIADIERELF